MVGIPEQVRVPGTGGAGRTAGRGNVHIRRSAHQEQGTSRCGSARLKRDETEVGGRGANA